MNPLDIINTVLRASVAVGEVIATAIASGDTSTLEALAKVCPRPEVLAARDKALQEQQRRKAEDELT